MWCLDVVPRCGAWHLCFGGIERVQTDGALEDRILLYLSKSPTPVTINELSYNLKIDENVLRETLLLMEMDGMIRWQGNGGIIIV